MATDVKVPVLGESITEATLGEWLKQPGDAVDADEPIASLETDKVALEVPAPEAGTLSEHLVAVGDTVEVGAIIAKIEAGGRCCGVGSQSCSGTGGSHGRTSSGCILYYPVPGSPPPSA